MRSGVSRTFVHKVLGVSGAAGLLLAATIPVTPDRASAEPRTAGMASLAGTASKPSATATKAPTNRSSARKVVRRKAAMAAPSGTGLWTTSSTPQIASALETRPVELGVAFTPRRSGWITGVGFYKGAGNTGTHTGTLWNANRAALGKVTLTSETTSGWQFATFSTPVAVAAGQKYIASYQAPKGRFALNTNYFSAPRATTDLSTSTNAGVYRYGGTSFPTTASSSNYWVDVRFIPAADSTTNPTTPTNPPVETAPAGRDKYKWPFTSTSIWNMPIGSNAAYKPLNLSPPLTGYGLVRVYLSFDATAPLRRLVDRGYWWPWVSGSSTPGSDTGYQVRLPDGLVIPPPPAPAYEDRPSAALQADGLAREFQYTVRPTGTSDVSMFEGVRAAFRLDGDGLTPAGQSGAHGGSGLTTIGGTLRKGELAGPDPVRHALAVTMNLTKWGTVDGGNITNGYRWPALWADSAHASTTFATGYGSLTSLGYTGRDGLGEGSLVALPASVDIASLGLETKEGAKLAWTYQNYGAYVVDNAGDTGSYDLHRLNIEDGVEKESPAIDSGDTTNTPFGRDMNKVFTRLAVVDNNSPTSIGGGGTPRQPLAPAITN